jgi:hypothetical protein
MRLVVSLVVGWLLATTASPAHAHAGSYDMKYVDGSNLILLTFNTHAPVSGLDIAHNIRLYDLVGAPIVYDEVRVEIHSLDGRDSGPLASSLLSEKTLPMLPTNESKQTFAYPVSGSYSLTAEFVDEGRTISEGEFAFDVGPGAAELSSGFGPLPLAAAFGLGVVVTLLVRRRRPTAAPPAAPGPSAAPEMTPAEPAFAGPAGRDVLGHHHGSG